jgi:hypothetical protein
VAYLEAATYAPSRRRSPESRNFTLGYERQLAGSFSVSVDLSHNLGRNLIVPTDLNAPAYFDYTTGARRTPQEGDAARPFGVPGAPIPAGVFDFLPDGYPYGGYRNLYLLESVGESEYTAVRLGFERRFVNGFSLQGNYTWSRMTNIGDDFRQGNSLPLNPNDREMERGRSATDIPHSFSVNGIMRLPWAFQLAWIVRARSGATVDPRVGQDLDGNRDSRERPVVDGRILERNSYRLPASVTADLSVVKRITVGPTRLEGRFEVFNVANRLNVDDVNNVWGLGASPLATFMTATDAAPPRRYQVSVRVTF